MSDWSAAGLPAFQVPGYGYTVDAGLVRTPFATSRPSQARMHRVNRHRYTVEVLLTQAQLVAAETFLKAQGFSPFTADLVSGGPVAAQSVRAMNGWSVTAVGVNTYRLRLALEQAL